MKITVVGTGHQGLVTGTCLAETGHQVVCMDRDADRVARLRAGEVPIHEPGLEELLVRNIEEERLSFTTDLRQAVADCLMIFLCVGTPVREDGEADISNVLVAAREVGGAMTGYKILVNKTASPPGTAEELERLLRETSGQPCDVVANPDFMKEGTAIDDFLRPDRVIIGCEDVRVREIMRELYSPFVRTGKPVLMMGRRSAEMAKYATNLMLAARISLMNQVADICEAWDCDIAEVREAVGADGRIGPTFLFAGIGYGGAGLPRDVAACMRLAREKGVPHELVAAVKEVNDRRRTQFVERIRAHFGGDLAGKTFAVWGASFKPRTDDLRGAPALTVMDALLDGGARIRVYDPVAGEKVHARYGGRVEVVPKYYAALEGADALVITAEWNEFRRPDYARMASLMRSPVIFDGRNLYTPSVMRENGFEYYSIGRPKA
ncbi:MAG TPA: UDP-glucose/GDP-mannose dehydrogenase family protein [Candidatus Hydrogenedentes bacterium]|nr:UDP-glucose/GDP-mannose dehydrogenase family protein [Candidatus Hydrogenedentota bacterium]